VDLPDISYEILFSGLNSMAESSNNGAADSSQSIKYYPKPLQKVNLKFSQSAAGLFPGAYQPCLPDILSLVIFQEISAVFHPDFEAEIPWSYPLLHDLVHFQPGFPPSKTPGTFMESKAGICLYPTTHLTVADQNQTRRKRALACP
jgi:hypothetical protein